MFTTTQAAYGRLAGENRTVFQLEYLEYIREFLAFQGTQIY